LLYHQRSQELLIASNLPECGCERERGTAADRNRKEKGWPYGVWLVEAKKGEIPIEERGVAGTKRGRRLFQDDEKKKVKRDAFL
jgi:hypothetical protein